MQGFTPDPVEDVDLVGSEPDPSVAARVTQFSEQRRPADDELPLADVEMPTVVDGVVRDERETTRFSLTVRVKQALFNTQYSEQARHTSWASAFSLIVTVAGAVALAITKWVVGPDASAATRISVASWYFGGVLASGLGLLVLRFWVLRGREPR